MMVRLDGKPLEDGRMVTVDHGVSTFIIKVRSMNRVTADTIKDMIERRYEVVSIVQKEEILYVR